jgi:peptide/nickel transport system permease protein
MILRSSRGRLERYSRDLRGFWRSFRRNRPAVIGLAILFILTAIAVLTDRLDPYNPFGIYPSEVLLPPSPSHPLGTDDLGRDILKLIMFGSKTSLLVGFSSVFIASSIGIIIGAISGYYGGRVEDILMRLTDMLLIIPNFFLILLIVALFGSSLRNVVLVIGFMTWPGTARLLRSTFLSLREQEFVQAARVVGASHVRIIFRHILPNGIYPVIVNSSLQVGSAILTEAGLSFLGLGDPSLVSWGRMLSIAQMYVRRAWWMAAFPGAAIFITVMAFNLIGDGLNDALNPRLRER